MIPILPIALAVAGLASGVASGISNIKNLNAETKKMQELSADKIDERAKQARLLMSKQKTSFLKGGAYFDSGSAKEIINETYDTMKQDINSIIKDADIQTNNYTRKGRTAFFNSVIKGIVSGVSGFAGADKMLGSESVGNLSSGLSETKNKISQWYNSKRGWSIGDFYSNTSDVV